MARLRVHWVVGTRVAGGRPESKDIGDERRMPRPMRERAVFQRRMGWRTEEDIAMAARKHPAIPPDHRERLVRRPFVFGCGTHIFPAEELAALVTRDSMIGTGLPSAPA